TPQVVTEADRPAVCSWGSVFFGNASGLGGLVGLAELAVEHFESDAGGLARPDADCVQGGLSRFAYFRLAFANAAKVADGFARGQESLESADTGLIAILVAEADRQCQKHQRQPESGSEEKAHVLASLHAGHACRTARPRLLSTIAFATQRSA